MHMYYITAWFGPVFGDGFGGDPTFEEDRAYDQYAELLEMDGVTDIEVYRVDRKDPGEPANVTEYMRERYIATCREREIELPEFF